MTILSAIKKREKKKNEEKVRNVAHRNCHDERFEFVSPPSECEVDAVGTQSHFSSAHHFYRSVYRHCALCVVRSSCTTSLMKVDIRNYVQINDLENCG